MASPSPNDTEEITVYVLSSTKDSRSQSSGEGEIVRTSSPLQEQQRSPTLDDCISLPPSPEIGMGKEDDTEVSELGLEEDGEENDADVNRSRQSVSGFSPFRAALTVLPV